MRTRYADSMSLSSGYSGARKYAGDWRSPDDINNIISQRHITIQISRLDPESKGRGRLVQGMAWQCNGLQLCHGGHTLGQYRSSKATFLTISFAVPSYKVACRYSQTILKDTVS